MAVTFSGDLTALRFAEMLSSPLTMPLDATDAKVLRLTQLLNTCKQMTTDRAPDSLPEVLADECVYRLGRYLQPQNHDDPNQFTIASAAWFYSGAMALCAPHRELTIES